MSGDPGAAYANETPAPEPKGRPVLFFIIAVAVTVGGGLFLCHLNGWWMFQPSDEEVSEAVMNAFQENRMAFRNESTTFKCTKVEVKETLEHARGRWVFVVDAYGSFQSNSTGGIKNFRFVVVVRESSGSYQARGRQQ